MTQIIQESQNSTLDEEIIGLNSLDKSFLIKVEKLSNGNINLIASIHKSNFHQNYIEIKDDIKFLLYIKKKLSFKCS